MKQRHYVRYEYNKLVLSSGCFMALFLFVVLGLVGINTDNLEITQLAIKLPVLIMTITITFYYVFREAYVEV